jgi:hypothetical protein
MDRLRLETTIGNARARSRARCGRARARVPAGARARAYTTFAGVTRAVSAFIEANMIV